MIRCPQVRIFDVAQFRFWAPESASRIRGVLVLVPGSNGDGRSMAQDSIWQGFASGHRLATVACRFTDRPHEQGFIEEYIAVSKGSGDALLTALSRLGERSRHPEIANAPLLMWGMSELRGDVESSAETKAASRELPAGRFRSRKAPLFADLPTPTTGVATRATVTAST